MSLRVWLKWKMCPATPGRKNGPASAADGPPLLDALRGRVYKEHELSENENQYSAHIFLEESPMPVLTVNGMRCGHCKAAVEEAAAKIPGVKNPVADPEARELRFEESAPVDMTALREAIAAIGFDPQ